MKKLAFAFVSTVAATAIRALNWVGHVAAASVLWISAQLCRVIAKTSYALMVVLDKEACDKIAAMMEITQPSDELVAQQTELTLLDAANKVKVHAETTGNWTDDHSDALEAVSNALLNECEWEEDDIHAYMRRLVESIDGLEYGTEER